MSNQKKEFVPYTQGCLKRCKFFVAVPKESGYGYDLKRIYSCFKNGMRRP